MLEDVAALLTPVDVAMSVVLVAQLDHELCSPIDAAARVLSPLAAATADETACVFASGTYNELRVGQTDHDPSTLPELRLPVPCGLSANNVLNT